jgi:pimeloyl-ACP methyl ester carboxylesterase
VAKNAALLFKRTDLGFALSEQLEMRVHGDASAPALVYLPGLHGDWTLIGRFRKALGNRVRFVEVTYPRTLDWSLEDYAAGVESALAERGISRGWLLGESFSSAVVWPLVKRKRFQIEGVVLAGGFVRHPMMWGVRSAEWLCGAISLTALVRILFGYARLARWRHRNSPEMLEGLQEFIARRTKLDQEAAKHRLHLLAQNDPTAIAREAELPIYGLTGLIDPIVPWIFVRSWLRKNCRALRDYKVITYSDHNVLGMAAEAAAEQVLKWMRASEQ